jgi:MYXO-CTERM domain-containing protein
MGTALDAMKSSGVDSDGDGVSDIDELVKGTDPNSAASGPLNGQRSSTGCAVRPEGAGGEGALAGLMMGIALVLGMRRRR